MSFIGNKGRDFASRNETVVPTRERQRIVLTRVSILRRFPLNEVNGEDSFWCN
jgi:hypothetical protein